jgi:hypothetical protein
MREGVDDEGAIRSTHETGDNHLDARQFGT